MYLRGGAKWPCIPPKLAVRCPSLGPFPSIGCGVHRPLTTPCPSSSSLPNHSLSTSLSFALVRYAHAAPPCFTFLCQVHKCRLPGVLHDVWASKQPNTPPPITLHQPPLSSILLLPRRVGPTMASGPNPQLLLQRTLTHTTLLRTPPTTPTPATSYSPAQHPLFPAPQPTTPSAPPNTHHEVGPPAPTQQRTTPATTHTRARHAWLRGHHTRSKGTKERVGGSCRARQRKD